MTVNVQRAAITKESQIPRSKLYAGYLSFFKLQKKTEPEQKNEY